MGASIYQHEVLSLSSSSAPKFHWQAVFALFLCVSVHVEKCMYMCVYSGFKNLSTFHSQRQKVLHLFPLWHVKIICELTSCIFPNHSGLCLWRCSSPIVLPQQEQELQCLEWSFLLLHYKFLPDTLQKQIGNKTNRK